MNDFKKILNYLMHGYMVCTCFAILLFFVGSDFSMLFYAPGASSGYISMGVLWDDQIGPLVGICAVLWVFLFPIALLVTYILAIKKRYVPFCVFIILDVFAVAAFMVYAKLSDNTYGFQFFLPDLIVSIVYVITFVRLVYLTRRGKARLTKGTAPS